MITRTPGIFFRLFLVTILCAQLAGAQTLNQSTPSWWNKYQHLLNRGADSGGGPTSSLSVGANADVSDECGPQSETYITLNPNHPTTLTAGSNEIFRLPMRGYFSSDNGSRWGGVDLPPAIVNNGTDFAPIRAWLSTPAATCFIATSWCSSARATSTAPRWQLRAPPMAAKRGPP